ncbi:hypothetical protein JRQ81_014852, partial [Phrynocephalus forsythii]
MKCYYRAEPEKRGYQKWMHQLWKQEYPNSKITELRLADQRRHIIRNKVFSKVELEEIQRSCESGGQQIIQIGGEIRLIIPGDIEQSKVEENMDVLQKFEPKEGSNRIGTPAELTIWQQELKNKILTHAALNEERGRLPILKTVPRKKLVPLMNDVNSALATIQIRSIEQINQLAYSAAVIVMEQPGIPQLKAPLQCIEKPRWKIRLELKIKRLRADASNLKNLQEDKLKN